MLGNDTDPDGDPLTAPSVTRPSHGAVTVNADGSFTYTPAANYNGPDSFTYRANDGAARQQHGHRHLISPSQPVNDAPVAATTRPPPRGQPASPSRVLANDTDPDGDLLTAALVRARHGTVTLNADGSFTYTPAANYNGTDSFTYRANDGALDRNIATVTITVTPVNDAPRVIEALGVQRFVDSVQYSEDGSRAFVITQTSSIVNKPVAHQGGRRGHRHRPHGGHPDHRRWQIRLAVRHQPNRQQRPQHQPRRHHHQHLLDRQDHPTTTVTTIDTDTGAVVDPTHPLVLPGQPSESGVQSVHEGQAVYLVTEVANSTVGESTITVTLIDNTAPAPA